jgi:hypothetical protein
VVLLVTAVSFVIAVADDRFNRDSLAFLKPFVMLLSSIGGEIAGNAQLLFRCLGLGVCSFLCIIALLRPGGASRFFLVSFGLAILGQMFLVDRNLSDLLAAKMGWYGQSYNVPLYQYDYIVAGVLGVSLYLLTGTLCSWSCARASDSGTFVWPVKVDKHFCCAESVFLLLVILIGIFFRVYAINHVTNYFEGELSPYSAGATSLQGMFVANRGHGGPWAPLGILYYVPIYFLAKVFGTTFVSLRLASAVVGVFSIVVLYFLARRLVGRSGALFAAALFSLNCLHIGWSRTDVHPHGVTAWPAMLICLVLLKAHETRRLVWGVVLAGLMGLSWHQYPSGQSAVAIPIVASLLFCVFNWRSSPLSRGQLVCVAFGIVFWFLGLPLSYYIADGRWFFLNPFNLTGPRALWGEQGGKPLFLTLLFVLFSASQHAWDIVQGIFYRVPMMFHQEWVPTFPGFHPRSVPWLEVPFVFVGFIFLCSRIRKFESVVILSWVLVAVLPSILSEGSWLKRFSTLFPCLDIIAGVGFFILLGSMRRQLGKFGAGMVATGSVLLLIAFSAFTAHVWFSGRFWKYGRTAEIDNVELIRPLITPGTVVIADVNKGYDYGKYLYLLLDHATSIEARPNVLMWTTSAMLDKLIEDPLLAVQLAPQTLPYNWTKLRSQVDEVRRDFNWTRVLFIIQSGENDDASDVPIVAKAAARCGNAPIIHTKSRGSAWNRLALIACDISNMTGNSQ